MKTILFTLLFLLPATEIHGQHIVQGNIMDEHGSPLPGVNVQEKGTRNGTTTDADGKFSLNVSDANAVMAFSFIGYKTQEIPLNGRTDMSVALEEECNVCFFDGRQVDLTL